MFKNEITLDDVIEFIIRNCDNTEYMDKISRTSFPFTTKYLNGDKNRIKKGPYYSNRTYGMWYIPGNEITLCNSSDVDSES